jgi:putative DNA primase/helicase
MSSSHKNNNSDNSLIPYGLNDHGNSQRVSAVHADNLRYCHAIKSWLVYDDCRWVPDDTGMARELAKDAMVHFWREAEESGNETRRTFANSSLSSGSISSMLRMLESELFVRPSDLDKNPYFLNFTNGTLDLRTSVLCPHRREDFITKLVHYDYCSNATCPLWRHFINEVTGNRSELAIYLQRALGYSLTGSTREKAVFIPFGEGNNGKTTLLSTFRNVISEYSALLQINSLMVRQEDNNSQSDLAGLRGARFVMTSESEAGQRLAQGKLKRITQGMGLIKAVRKYENPIEFPETHKLWLDTNRKPVITDADDKATFNRLHPIPFMIQIPQSKIDRDLPEKLLGEAPGILSWAVDGAQQWFEHGLAKPAEVETANDNWRSESDPISRFFADRIIPGGQVSSTALYDAYAHWANVEGEETCIYRAFTAKLASLVANRSDISKKRTNEGAAYSGISLRRRGGRVGLSIAETS